MADKPESTPRFVSEEDRQRLTSLSKPEARYLIDLLHIDEAEHAPDEVDMASLFERLRGVADG